MEVSIWNVMRVNEYNRILNKWNGLPRVNIIWDGTETGSPPSTRIIEFVYKALEALEIVYRAHSAAV